MTNILTLEAEQTNDNATSWVINTSYMGDIFPVLDDGNGTDKIKRIEIKLQRFGTLTGNVDVKVWTLDGADDPDTLLETYSVPTSSIPTTAEVLSFYFDASAVEGVRLAYTCNISDGSGDASNRIEMKRNNLTDDLLDGQGIKSTDGGVTWLNQNYNHYFRVFSGASGEVNTNYIAGDPVLSRNKNEENEKIDDNNKMLRAGNSLPRNHFGGFDLAGYFSDDANYTVDYLAGGGGAVVVTNYDNEYFYNFGAGHIDGAVKIGDYLFTYYQGVLKRYDASDVGAGSTTIIQSFLGGTNAKMTSDGVFLYFSYDGNAGNDYEIKKCKILGDVLIDDGTITCGSAANTFNNHFVIDNERIIGIGGGDYFAREFNLSGVLQNTGIHSKQYHRIFNVNNQVLMYFNRETYTNSISNLIL